MTRDPCAPPSGAWSGKRVLVTGAARNTGYCIAKLFAERGAEVWVNDREAAEVEGAVRGLGAMARPAPADLAVPRQIETLFKRVSGGEGRLDVLVNNACHQGLGHCFVDTPLSFLDEVWAVNLRAPFLCAQLAARRMAVHGGGAIVNIGSNTARRPLRNRGAYVATKGGLEALTRAMALELAPAGIRVNAVVPGQICTDRWEGLSPEQEADRVSVLPLGRPSTGREIAEAVLFVASPDRAGSLTGSCLVVDGGASVQLVPPGLDA